MENKLAALFTGQIQAGVGDIMTGATLLQRVKTSLNRANRLASATTISISLTMLIRNRSMAYRQSYGGVRMR